MWSVWLSSSGKDATVSGEQHGFDPRKLNRMYFFINPQWRILSWNKLSKDHNKVADPIKDYKIVNCFKTVATHRQEVRNSCWTFIDYVDIWNECRMSQGVYGKHAPRLGEIVGIDAYWDYKNWRRLKDMKKLKQKKRILKSI